VKKIRVVDKDGDSGVWSLAWVRLEGLKERVFNL